MKAFDLYGEMSLKGMGKVTGELDKVKSRTEQVQKGMKIMGAAFTAVGAAGLALVASSKKINAQLGVTALNLDVTTKEMRDLTLATTNVTFPIAEVVASFDLLARAGVKNTQVLKDTATAFDTLGDATGKSASQVTQIMVPAMKTFGLTAKEIAKKTDLMTYMSRESTMSLDDFATMVGYTTPELVEAGLTIDELAIALIHMEKQGYAPGRVMTREFMKATTAATKEQIPLYEALGITSAEMVTYKSNLEGIEGMTEKYAETANKQYTIMDKLRQKWSELTLQYGTFLQPLEPILATMTALGPVLFLFSTVILPKLTLTTAALRVKLIALAAAHKIAAAATWLWNIALAANPIGIVIVAIGGLIAAGIALWKNWDKVVAFFTGGVKEMEQAIDTLEIKVRDASEDMIADVGKATQAAINNANKVADTERQKLDERAGFYRDFQYERMRLLDEQMIAEIKAVDPVLAAELEAANKELAAIDERGEAREKAGEDRRIAGLKEDLEADDLSKRERRRIKDELEAIEDARLEEGILEDRNRRIAELDMAGHLEKQKTAITTQLEAQIAMYKDDEAALKLSLENKEELTEEHIKKILALYGKLTARGGIEPSFAAPETGPPAGYASWGAYESTKKAWKASGESWADFAGGRGLGHLPIPKLAKGALITRPTLAMLGEDYKRELVLPEDMLKKLGGTYIYNVSFPGAVVREELDLQKISELVSQKLFMLQQRRTRAVGG